MNIRRVECRVVCELRMLTVNYVGIERFAT